MVSISPLDSAERLSDRLKAIPAPDFPPAVPDGKSGNVKIDTFKLTDSEIGLDNLRRWREGEDWACVRPGTYQRLVIDDEVVMSNTQMEARTNKPVLDNAKGHVLITGLGLGIVPALLAKKRGVKSVIVIERNHDVVKLVAPHMPAKVRVVQGDAYTWCLPPLRGGKDWRGEMISIPSMFEFTWHDIWTTYGRDNLPLFKKMRAHHRPWSVHQECWCEVESMRRRG